MAIITEITEKKWLFYKISKFFIFNIYDLFVGKIYFNEKKIDIFCLKNFLNFIFIDLIFIDLIKAIKVIPVIQVIHLIPFILIIQVIHIILVIKIFLVI